ncbi:tetratricopeptide repeat protein [Weeksellaceae bacterium TAE3-ERU29]|nr:tetratricopeptide repeat protein [Weeksellaceae bacterium TAE3-ERU29]
MEDDFLDNELIERFEEMIENNESLYYDSDELEDIIGYYLDIGDLPYAKIALDYAKKIHSDSIDIQVKELEYYVEMDELFIASEMIEDLKKVVTDNVDFTLAQAKYWSLKGMHKIAIKFYEDALENSDEKDFILHCLGNEHMASNNIGKALYYFKSAIELNIEDEIAFAACVDCFNEIHKHKECIDFINQYIDLNPYSAEAWFELGVQYLMIKDYEKAYEAFDYSVVILPKSINAMMQMGFCLEQLGKYEEAIEIYKEAKTFDDTAAYIHLKIGQTYLKINEDFKALKSLHNAIHEDPQLDKAWYEAALIYEQTGNYSEALHYINRAIELDNINVAYYKRKAYLNIQLGYLEEAQITYHKIIQLESGKFLNWYAFAELQIILGEYQSAVKTILKAYHKFSKPALLYQLSTCYFLLNYKKEGIEALQKAKSLGPDLLEEMLEKYPILKNNNDTEQYIDNKLN